MNDLVKRIIVFGGGDFGKKYIDYVRQYEENIIIVAIADNNNKNMPALVKNIPVINPDSIVDYSYDDIIIAIDEYSELGIVHIYEIEKQLINMGVEEEKIHLHWFTRSGDVRNRFLRNYSRIVYETDVQGSCAECGVFLGDFSKTISQCFPDRRLYLFDTFEGFCKDDISQEDEKALEWLGKYGEHFAKGNEIIAKLRCYNRNNLKIVKGFVPETLSAVDENEKFCFVNLDMDLYTPQLEALRFFAPRMSTGGVILLHDYFEPGISGTKRAIKKFSEEWEFSYIPIGDYWSVAISF